MPDEFQADYVVVEADSAMHRNAKDGVGVRGGPETAPRQLRHLRQDRAGIYPHRIARTVNLSAITINCLSNPLGQKVGVARLKWRRRIARQSHLREYIAVAHETLPGAAVVTDAALLDYARGRRLTIYHPAGTCAMGLDWMAAVDPHPCVHGVERLLAGKVVGSQALTSLGGLALNNANYTLVGASGAVNITPATLTYVADATGRTYGSATSVLTGSVTGFVGADTLAGATTGALTLGSAAVTGNSYAIAGYGLTAAYGNYQFVQAAGNGSALTITARPITVTADALSGVYDDAIRH